MANPLEFTAAPCPARRARSEFRHRRIGGCLRAGPSAAAGSRILYHISHLGPVLSESGPDYRFSNTDDKTIPKMKETDEEEKWCKKKEVERDGRVQKDFRVAMGYCEAGTGRSAPTTTDTTAARFSDPISGGTPAKQPLQPL